MKIRTYLHLSIALICLLFVFATMPAFAQDERPGSDFGQQKGRVTDLNGKPLAGVEVSIGGTTVKTDENGEFVFRRLEPRVYNFVFKMDGYQQTSIRKEVAAIFNNRPIEVKLTPIGQQAQQPQMDVQKIFQEGTQLLQQGDFVNAQAKFEQIKDANPNQKVAYAYIGLCLMQQGKYNDALESLKVAIEAMPEQPMVLTLIGDAYLYTDKPGDAMVYYEKLVELNVADAQTYLNMGIALHAQGQKDDAILAFAKATELQPDLADAWLRLGAAQSDGKKYAECAVSLEKYLQLDPAGDSVPLVKQQLAKAYYEQAIVLVNSNKSVEAKPLLEKVIAYAPASEEATNAKALLADMDKK